MDFSTIAKANPSNVSIIIEKVNAQIDKVGKAPPHPVAKAIELSKISTTGLFNVFIEQPHITTSNKITYYDTFEQLQNDTPITTTAFDYIRSRFIDLTDDQVWSCMVEPKDHMVELRAKLQEAFPGAQVRIIDL